MELLEYGEKETLKQPAPIEKGGWILFIFFAELIWRIDWNFFYENKPLLLAYTVYLAILLFFDTYIRKKCININNLTFVLHSTSALVHSWKTLWNQVILEKIFYTKAVPKSVQNMFPSKWHVLFFSFFHVYLTWSNAWNQAKIWAKEICFKSLMKIGKKSIWSAEIQLKENVLNTYATRLIISRLREKLEADETW